MTHPTHKTRFFDAGHFYEICIHCGRSNSSNSLGKLSDPCPMSKIKPSGSQE